MLWSGLMLGFLMGMRHAMDADHLAAMATFATHSNNTRQTLRLGVAWGLGHTTILFGVGLLVLLLDQMIPAAFTPWLEFGVGIMLVLLGLDVTWRMRKSRSHFHVHDHGDGQVHLHAHSHSGPTSEAHPRPASPENHAQAPHHHGHGLSGRALLVGMVHGLAGSAPLILLTVQSAPNPMWGLAYILLFGLGSMVGMGILSLAISFPLRLASQRMSMLYNTICLIIGLCTIGLGGLMIVQHG